MEVKEGDMVLITDCQGKSRARVVFDTNGNSIRYTTVRKYRKWKRDFKLVYLQTTDIYVVTGRNING